MSLLLRRLSALFLLLALVLGDFPLAARASARDWLDEPQARPELDTLLAPPGRPLGGRDVEQDPALSPNGRWLAYACLSDGNWDIWLRDLQAGPGDAPRRLTDHVAADLRPTFSPDGRSLLFITQREDVAGDIWELPLQRRPGRLKAGEARALVRRPGAQDHPSRDARGALIWEEESALGPRVMRQEPKGTVLEVACPASLPRPGHGGLYFLMPLDEGEELAFVPDSLLRQSRPAATPVWRPSSGLLDFRPGPDQRLWVCMLEDATILPGRELALPSQLFQVERSLTRPPRPLLERGRVPRQLSLAGSRLVLTADGRPSTLWLEDAEGRFPIGAASGASEAGRVEGGAPRAQASAGTWLELARRYEGDELGLPLLQTIQAAWPGSKASDAAALREMRLRMLAGEDSTVLLDRISQLKGWLAAPDAVQRLASMEAELRLRGGTGPFVPLAEQLALARRLELPGACAEAALALARLELGAGQAHRALSALLELESLPDTLPEQADGLMLKVSAWEALGEFSAARGALAALAIRHPDRPELLAEWLRRDLATLAPLSDSRARLRLRERLEDLAGIPALHMALVVELARREGASGADGRTVAREDLRLVLEQDPGDLPPFQRRAWTRGQALLADLRRQDGALDLALQGLTLADGLLEEAGEPGLQGLLRVKRVDWLLERAMQAAADADWEAVEADTRLMLTLDPVETRAWRLRGEALAALGRLDQAERELRRERRHWGRKTGSLRGAALQRRAVDTWALGLLLSWHSEQRPARLPESIRLVEEALALDDRLAAACLTQSWNLGRDVSRLESRRGGLGALVQEVGRMPETLARWRHQGLASLKEPDLEAMRDRAILLAERGMRHAESQGQRELAAALATNLGNLHFSRGEFGAVNACRAWEHRLDLQPTFSRPQDRLRFLMQLGSARQWSGDLDGAARDLDSAQTLATRLGAQQERRELLARLAMLAGERGQLVEAQAWLRQALALEVHPGQRALLWRNLAMVQLEAGDAEASTSLEEAAREAAAGPWPMEPAQNWLRLRLFGVGLPLWNFPGLYTGQGRLDWGPEEEAALRQALRDELSGQEGALDRRMDGLHARRRLMRRQGDVDGMLRLDLVIARELAILGRWTQSLARYRNVAVDARAAVLPGPEARAVEGAMAVAVMAGRAGVELDPASLAALRAELQGLLGASALFMPLEQRLRLELLRVQELDDRATELDEVHALHLRSEGLLALEDLEGWIKGSAQLLSWRQRLSLDLAWARLLCATGEVELAEERLASWQEEDLPPASALLLTWARAQLGLVRRDAALAGKALASVEQQLNRLPAWPEHAPGPLLVDPVQAGLLEQAQAAGAKDYRQELDQGAWRRSQWLWEQAAPTFASESATNAWSRWRADLKDAAQLREQGMASARDEAAVLRLDSLMQADQAGALWSTGPLALWTSGATPDDSLTSGWRGQGVTIVGLDSLGSWLCASPRIHAACRGNALLAPDLVCLITGSSLPPIAGVEELEARQLEASTSQGLDSRVLALDGILHLVPGAEQASWFEVGGQRLALRQWMSLDLPGELLVVGEVDWKGREPAAWSGACLVLERLLAQCGLRRMLLPAPGTALHGAALAAFAQEQVRESLANPAARVSKWQPPSGWLALGAPPLTAQEAALQQAQGLESLVRRGAEHRKAERPEAAWRAWRRALRLAVRLKDQPASAALIRQCASLALDLQDASAALDLLLEQLPQVDSTAVEWERVAPRLVQLADLALRPSLADSLWIQWIQGPLEAQALPDSGVRLRQAMEQRLAVLARRGLSQRASALARAHAMLPVDGDPRRALFLARLYLDTEWALLAKSCLEREDLRWSELAADESLEHAELASLVEQRLGNLAAAQRWMDEAARRVAALPADSLRQAQLARQQADLSWMLGDYSRCERELDLAQAWIPHHQEERALRLDLQVANTRGLLATELDEGTAAAAHFAQALRLAQAVGDPQEISAVCNNQSRLAQHTGQWAEALDYALQAQAQDSLGSTGGHSRVSLRNYAASLRGLLSPDLHPGKGRGVMPTQWANLPEALLRQSHAREGLEALLPALEAGVIQGQAAGDLREACRLQVEIAQLALDLGEGERAQAVAAVAAASASERGFLREQLEAELVQARALVALGRESDAEGLLWLALGRAEQESARLAPLRFDPGRGRMQRRITDELVALLGPARPWEALAASERGRTLGLREMVARSTLGHAMPELDTREELEAVLTQAVEGRQEWLAWHLGQGEAWAFWWRDGELKAWPLAVDRDSLRQLVALHRNRILAFMTAEETGARLAEWILPPAWLQDPPSRAWCLPQAELAELALESLRLPSGAWLGERTAISRCGSLAEMAYSADLPGGKGPAAIWSAPAGPGMEELEYTSLESGELLRLYPDSQLLEGTAASESALREDSASRRFRHFACHALHDARRPAESALLLAADPRQDGRMRAPEIAALELPTGLTMLSACETALGRSGEDASASLPRAFMAAGSRGVVASLWKVDDLATAVLVKHLYRALAEGLPADVALQQAQQAVRVWVNGHPAYWAAFCLTGQPRPESVRARTR